MFARPNEQGAPIGDFVSTYESREDLAEAIRTGTYRERAPARCAAFAETGQPAAAATAAAGCAKAGRRPRAPRSAPEPR
jgi:hypothetical protein